MIQVDGKKLRVTRGKMTQKALSEGICAASTISQIENGKAHPNEQVAVALAERLGVELACLLVDVVEPLGSDLVAEELGAVEQPAINEVAEMAKVTESTPFRRPTYLSRTESNHWLFINAFSQKADTIMQEMTAHNSSPPEVIAMLREGSELIARAMAERLKTVDLKAVKKLHRESWLLDIALRYRSDAERHYKQFYAEDRELRRKAVEELGGDPIGSMAEQLLVFACMKCNGSPRCSGPGCPIYESLNALDIPEWDMAHPNCKYAGAGVVAEEAV